MCPQFFRSRMRLFVEATAWVLVGALAFGVPGISIRSAAAAGGRTSVGAVGAALTIATDPVGASIYVDGKLRGESPLTLDRVAAGEHRVRVEMDGYLENSRVVLMEPGESESLRVDLTPSVTQVALLQVEPEPTPAVPPPPRPIIKAKEGGKGKKIALIAIGAAAVAGGGYLLLPKNKPPTVGGVTAEPGGGIVGIASATTYRFSAQASDPDSGDTLSYEWVFGDGQTSTQASPTHVFAQSGSFNVTVTVKDKKGESAGGNVQVTVVGLTGAWMGTFDAVANSIVFTFNLTQAGPDISGTYSDPVNGNKTVTGHVRAPRAIELTGESPQFTPAVFSGNLSDDGNVITGSATGYGAPHPFTLSRQ